MVRKRFIRYTFFYTYEKKNKIAPSIILFFFFFWQQLCRLYSHCRLLSKPFTHITFCIVFSLIDESLFSNFKYIFSIWSSPLFFYTFIRLQIFTILFVFVYFANIWFISTLTIISFLGYHVSFWLTLLYNVYVGVSIWPTISFWFC